MTTEGEVFALLVARAALEQYRGTPFHRKLALPLQKLAASLKDKVTFDLDDLSRAMSFKAMGTQLRDRVTASIEQMRAVYRGT